MSSLFDSLSDELFQILKGSGKTLTLYGEDGNKTYEPKLARRVFAAPDNIMISVIEAGSDSEVKLYLSQSTDVKEISKLINTLRQITTRYNVLFNVRKYGRELQPKDFAYQASVMEASMYGSTKTSYQKFGDAKLIVRHCRPIVEGVIGARGRNIIGMFVETRQGERFKFPENHLSAGRAFAQHINQGGKPHDEVATKLVTLAQESLQLARVNRYIHHSRNSLSEEAVGLRAPIRDRLVELRRAFLTMGRPRGYNQIKESLPTTTANLNEATSDRLGQLQSLLMIDSNHALAESLMPVALLKMGENMNQNSMFHSHVVIDESAADALAEALANEYGLEESAWTRFGSNFFFNESISADAAAEYADIMESGFQIVESSAVILDYATQWTQHRFSQSGATGFDDKKDRAKHEAGIKDLATGLQAILDGHVAVPELPETGMPQFSKVDTDRAMDLYFLDLYVTQDVLANEITNNYVSTIMDKLAEGKPLDGAEKTISGKLVGAVKADLGEGLVDESYYSDDPTDDHSGAYERELENIIDTFDYAAFIEDVLPFVVHGEEKDEPIETKYVMDNLDGYISYDMDHAGFRANKGGFTNWAKDLFDVLKPDLESRGYHFDTVVKEFAEMEEKPEHHGVAAGDHVATDMGPATVISIEGEMASLEFLHGGAKTMHIDDMTKVAPLANFGEEAELAQWFESFDPENVLGEAPVNWAHGIPERNKVAAPANSDGSFKNNDRVKHPKYGPGTVVASNGKMIKVEFDNSHENLPEYRTVTLTPGTVSKVVDETEELDELSSEKVNDYFGKAASARARDERKAVRHGDDEAAARVARRDKGLSTAFKKMREVEEAYQKKAPTATDYIEWNGEEDVEVEIEYSIDDGSFATGLDYPKFHSDGPTVDIDAVVVKATGEDIRDLMDRDQLMNLQQACIDDAAERDSYERDQAADYARDDHFDEEEVLGGDLSDDLKDDVKIDEGDEAFRAQLANVLKNANFRK